MTVTGGLTVRYRPGAIIGELKTSAAVTQGAPVEVSGSGTVAQAAAGSTKIIGVALQTSSVAGDLLPIQGSGYVMPLKAKGAVTAGDPVGAASDGSAAVSTIAVAAFGDVRKVIGIALYDIADGATGFVYVYR